ncbi:MAG: penicillin-binding protein [Marinilabiliales bacterium]|nr:MAG: penicillin-binding protein [Marinilabiliales bacterium]
MKIFVTIIFLSLILIPFKDKDVSISSAKLNNPIHDLLVETISKENIPGMIVAIIDAEGIRTIESVGVRKIGSSEKLTTDDLIHLGSCTKAMTSALLATLVQNGEITWETTLTEVFPDLKGIIHEDYYNITLHQLVTHRARVPANAKDWRLFQNLEIKERRVKMIEDNLTEPSQIAKGKFNYSNLGYMIAGSMAEKITGLSWEILMQDRLFEPLGMSSAGFGAPGTPDQTDQPWGHYKSAETWQSWQVDNPEAIGPAGSVHCSFKDWAKFISLQLPKKKSSIINHDQLSFLIDPIGDYASGWYVQERSWANGISFFHNGSNNFWYTAVWVAPEINRAFMVGTNSYDENSFTVCDKIISKLIEIDKEFP